MSIISQGLARARLSIFVFFALVLAGVYAYIDISKDSFPDIAIPIMYAVSTLDGISAEDAEKMIVAPMEDRLKNLEGLKKVEATAFEGGGFVMLEFDAGYDIDKAHDDAKEALDNIANDLPSDATEPKIREITTSDFPVVSFSLSGDFTVRELTAIAEEIEDRLVSLPDVLEVRISGTRKEIVEVNIDPVKLEAYGISARQLLTNVQQANLVVAAGTLERESGKFSIKLPGLIEDYVDIDDIPIVANDNGVVTLGDLATSKLSYRDPDSLSSLNGKKSITLDIMKTSDANALDTVGAVKLVIGEIMKHLPDGLEYEYSNDSSENITDILSTLQNSILFSLILVVIVLFAALGVRTGFLVGIAIPSSFLLGILLLYSFGYRVNMMVLFALILASGLLVDGSIVVTEFASRRLSDGLGIRQAFREASSRMAMPIIASTLTTLAAFLPLMFWPGLIGEFMFYLPLTLTLVLIASLAVALFFLPIVGANFGRVGVILLSVLSGLVSYFIVSTIIGFFTDNPIITYAVPLIPGLIGLIAGGIIFKKILQKNDPYYFPRPDTAKNQDVTPESTVLDESKLNKFYLFYLKVVRHAIYHPKKVLVGAFAFLIISWATYIAFGNGVEFFPYVETDSAVLAIHADGSLSISEKEDLVSKVADLVYEMEEFDAISSVSTKVGDVSADNGSTDLIGKIQLQFINWSERKPIAYYVDKLLAESKKISGISVISSIAKGGPPGDAPVTVRLYSDSYKTLLSEAMKIRSVFDKIEGLKDIEDQLPSGGIEWVLRADQAEASKFNISIREVGDYVRLVTDGFKVTSFRPENSKNEIDVVARFPSEYRSLDQIDSLRVNSSMGAVSISNFIDRVAQPKANDKNRFNGKKTIVITSQVYDGYQVAKVFDQVKDEISKLDLDPDLEVVYSGEDESTAEAGEFLSKAFIIALLMMFLILLAQFNRFLSAVIILSAIVMSTTGVLWGLLITGEAFGIVMCGIGIIALAGIIVNNNIVLLDTYDVLSARMKDKKEAIILSCIYRLRPILLTSITTIIGLMPTAMRISLDFLEHNISYGSPRIEIFYQISLTIVSGMALAMFLTLLVTPAALSYVADRDMKVGRKYKASRKLLRPTY